MNSEEITRKTLKALGEANRLLREHAVEVERMPGVKSTTTRLEVVEYQSGSMVEGFVEAEMQNNTGLCWCLDVRWTDESFKIEATLDRNSSCETETIKRVPLEVVHNVEDFPGVLIRVTRDLLALEAA